MADFSLTRSAYLRAMYGDQKSAIDSLSPVNINQVNANLMDADQIQSIAESNVQSAQAALEAQKQAEAQKEADVPWYQKLANTFTNVWNGITDGFFSAIDAVGDFFITAAGGIGAAFGADTQWAQDAITYDWEGHATHALSYLNPLTYASSGYLADPSAYNSFADPSTFRKQNQLTIDNGYGGQIVYNIASGVGQVLPSVALAFATGGTSLTGTAATALNIATQAGMGFVQGFGMGTEQALNEGHDFGSSSLYGLMTGGVGALEQGVEAGIGGLVSSITGKATGTILDNMATKVATRLSSNAGTQAVIRGAVKVVFESAQEGTEEAFESFIDPFLREVSIQKGAISEAFGSKSDEYVSDILQSAFVGFASALVAGGIREGVANTSAKKRAVVSKLGEMDQSLTEANILQQGGRTEEARAAYENARKIANEINTEYGSYFQRRGERRFEKARARAGINSDSGFNVSLDANGRITIGDFDSSLGAGEIKVEATSNIDPNTDEGRQEIQRLEEQTGGHMVRRADDGSYIFQIDEGDSTLSVDGEAIVDQDGNTKGTFDEETSSVVFNDLPDISSVIQAGDIISQTGAQQVTFTGEAVQYADQVAQAAGLELQSETDSSRTYVTIGEARTEQFAPAPAQEQVTVQQAPAPAASAGRERQQRIQSLSAIDQSLGNDLSLYYDVLDTTHEAQSVNIAPNYKTSGNTFADIEKIRDQSQKRYIQSAEGLASAMGINLVDQRSTVGGYTQGDGSGYTTEPSYVLDTDHSDPYNAMAYSSIMAAIGNETQDSVIFGVDLDEAHIADVNCKSVNLPVKNLDKVPSILREAGIDFTLDNDRREVDILFFDGIKKDKVESILDKLEQGGVLDGERGVTETPRRTTYLGARDYFSVLRAWLEGQNEVRGRQQLRHVAEQALARTAEFIQQHYPDQVDSDVSQWLGKADPDFDLLAELQAGNPSQSSRGNSSTLSFIPPSQEQVSITSGTITDQLDYNGKPGAASVEVKGKTAEFTVNEKIDGSRLEPLINRINAASNAGQQIVVSFPATSARLRSAAFTIANEADLGITGYHDGKVTLSSTADQQGYDSKAAFNRHLNSFDERKAELEDLRKRREERAEKQAKLEQERQAEAERQARTDKRFADFEKESQDLIERLSKTGYKLEESNADKVNGLTFEKLPADFVAKARRLYNMFDGADFDVLTTPVNLPQTSERTLSYNKARLIATDRVVYDVAKARLDYAITSRQAYLAVKQVENSIRADFNLTDDSSSADFFSAKDAHDIFLHFNSDGTLGEGANRVVDSIIEQTRAAIESDPSFSGKAHAELRSEIIEELNASRAEIIQQIRDTLLARATESKEIQLRKQIADLEEDIAAAKRKYQEKLQTANERLLKQRQDDADKLNRVKSELRTRIDETRKTWQTKAKLWEQEAVMRSHLARVNRTLRNRIEQISKPQSAGGNPKMAIPSFVRDLANITSSTGRGGLTSNQVDTLINFASNYTRENISQYTDLIYSEDLKSALDTFVELNEEIGSTPNGISRGPLLTLRGNQAIDILRQVSHSLRQSQVEYARRKRATFGAAIKSSNLLSEVDRNKRVGLLTKTATKGTGQDFLFSSVLTPEAPAYNILVTQQWDAFSNKWKALGDIDRQYGTSYLEEKYHFRRENLDLKRNAVDIHGMHMSLDNALYAYATYRAEENRIAVSQSGLQYRNPNTGKNETASPLMLTQSDFDVIPENLRNAVDDVLSRFFNDYSWKQISETYKIRNGVSLSKVDGLYLPQRRGALNDSTIEADNFLATMASLNKQSFLRSRTGTRTPVNISEGFFGMFDRFTNQMTDYIYRAEAKENLNGLLTTRYDDRTTFSTAMKGILGDRQWHTLLDYYEESLGYKFRTDSDGGVLSSLFSNAQAAAIGLNPSSTLKQFLSGLFIQRVTGWHNWFMGFLRGWRILLDYKTQSKFLFENSGVLYNRWKNGGAAGANLLVKNLSRFKQAMTFLTNGADKLTIVTWAWGSAQYQAQAEGKGRVGTQQNMSAALPILEEIVAKTQSNSLPLYTSIWRGRSGSFISKVFFTFQADSQHKFEFVLEDTWGKRLSDRRKRAYPELIAQTEREIADFTQRAENFNYKDSNAPTVKELTEVRRLQDNARIAEETLKTLKSMQEWDNTHYSPRQTAKRLAGITSQLLASAVLSVLITQGARWMKGYDQDKDDWKDTLVDLAQEAFVTYIPFVGTLANALLNNQSSISSIQLEGIQQAMQFINDFYNAALKGNLSQNTMKLLYSALSALGYTSGIPIKTLMDYMVGIAKRTGTEGGFNLFNIVHSYNSSYLRQQVTSQAEAGNLTSAVRNMQSMMFTFKTGNVSWKLAKELVEHGVFARDSLTDGLTSDQQQEFRAVYSQADAEAEKMIASSVYASLSDEAKALALSRIYDAYYQAAQIEVQMNGEAKTGTSKLARLLTMMDGSGLDTLNPLVAAIGEMEAKRGQTRKQQAIRYLNQQRGISKAERYLALWLAGFGLDDNAKNIVIRYLMTKGADRKMAKSLFS